MKKEEVEEIRRIAKQAEEICREIEILSGSLAEVSKDINPSFNSFTTILGVRNSPGLVSIPQGVKILRLGIEAFITELNDKLSQIHFPGTTTAAKIVTVEETPKSSLDAAAFHNPTIPTSSSIADDITNRINNDPALREIVGQQSERF